MAGYDSPDVVYRIRRQRSRVFTWKHTMTDSMDMRCPSSLASLPYQNGNFRRAGLASGSPMGSKPVIAPYRLPCIYDICGLLGSWSSILSMSLIAMVRLLRKPIKPS